VAEPSQIINNVFSLFDHIVRVPNETYAKKIWRTVGDYQDALVLRGWRLYISSKTWNPVISPWMKQLTWPTLETQHDSHTIIYQTRNRCCYSIKLWSKWQ